MKEERKLAQMVSTSKSIWIKFIALSLILVLITGCASNQFVGYGVIKAKIPHKKMLVAPDEGAAIGATTGLVGGSILGLMYGMVAAIESIPFGFVLVPAYVVAGAAIGGVIGFGWGYVYDNLAANSVDSSAYKLQFDNKDRGSITAYQLDSNVYKPSTRVKIYVNDQNVYFFKAIAKDNQTIVLKKANKS